MRVGFIGLGNMGGPMALNMIKAGHSLIVNDIRRAMAEAHLAGGAQWADTPAAVAAQERTGADLAARTEGGRGGRAGRERHPQRDYSRVRSTPTSRPIRRR